MCIRDRRMLEFAETLEPKCKPTAVVRKGGAPAFTPSPKVNPRDHDTLAPPENLAPVPVYKPFSCAIEPTANYGVIQKLFEERILVIDGAMGTSIQKYKLDEPDFRGERYANHTHPLKGNNDILVITRPDVISEIHSKFLECGADFIETNTFSGTSIAQADYELQAEEEVYLINQKAAEIAKECCAKFTAKDPSKPRFVCGAIGPTNRTLSVSPSVENPAFRNVTFDEVVAAYTVQIDSPPGWWCGCAAGGDNL